MSTAKQESNPELPVEEKPEEKSEPEPKAPQILNPPRMVKKKSRAPKQPVPMPAEVIVIGEDPKPRSYEKTAELLAESVAKTISDPIQEVREELEVAVKTIDEEINGLNEKIEAAVKSLRPIKSDQFYKDQINLLKFKEIKEEAEPRNDPKPPEKAAMRLGTKAFWGGVITVSALFLGRCVKIWIDLGDD